MIRNQSEHELQVGTVELGDGEYQFALAIAGSKKYTPAVTLTPYGDNSNFNTFTASQCVWGSVKLPVVDAVSTYNLTKKWVEKNRKTASLAKLNFDEGDV